MKVTIAGLATIMIPPISQLSPKCFVFLHGLGSSGDEFVSFAEAAQNAGQKHSQFKAFESTQFVLPTAPKIPVTANNGMRMNAWFDMAQFGGHEWSETEKKNYMGSVGKVMSFVDDLVQTHGVKPQDIYLGGFSQGASMTVASSILLPYKIGGFFICSGFIRAKDYLLKELEAKGGAAKIANKDTPVFSYHAKNDGVIGYSQGVEVYDLLNEFGFSKTQFTEHGNRHGLPDIPGFFSDIAGAMAGPSRDEL